MATVALTKETFNETIADNDTVIIDFWADWCTPCKSFAPTFESASAQHDEIVFAKVDTEDQQEISEAFGIRSIPTLMVFRDQIMIYNQPGALPQTALSDLIGQIKAMDMEDVRRQIAAQDNGSAAADEATG